MSTPIYLDYQATTPLHADVLAEMMPYLTTHFGNPHSTSHRAGRTAKAGVELARERVARALGVNSAEIIFTSGATESNNLALRGAMEAAPAERNRLITIETEHSCVLETARDLQLRGFPVTILPVQHDGLLDLTLLENSLGNDVALVSIMAVNNEIGVIQNTSEISRIVRKYGAVFHSDIAQAFCKIPLNAEDFDLASISGHKIYGPKGIGVLFRREAIKLRSQMTGGGQEADLRSGTLSPALCVGLGAAANLALADSDHMRMLFNLALAHLNNFPVSWQLNGSRDQRYLGNLNITFNGTDVGRLLSDAREVMASSGAACAASAGRLSHVLAALGLNDAAVRSSVRIGFGTMTTAEDVIAAIDGLRAAALLQRKNTA